MTIDVDGVSRTVNVVNGKATFYTAEFNKVIGKRTVWAFFDGNVNFTASRDKETYMVNTRTLLDDEWNVTARDIYVGEAGNITVNLPKDVTGFVANILYRGIKWTFFPTTLLAACDSCKPTTTTGMTLITPM